MAWTFVGVSTAAGVTGTPLTLTEPAGVRDGDLLIACISSRTTSLTSISNTGWTLVAEQKTNNILTDTNAIASGAMFRRVRDGTTDLTFTLPASGTSICFGRMIAYRGVAQASPVDVSTAATTAVNTLAVSVTGLTTTQANDLIVAMCAGGQEAAWSVFDAVTDPSVASGATDTSTAPTAGTWIERADSSTTTGTDTSLAIFDAIKASAGATGNLTATASLGAGHVVIAGAFKISPASTADAWDISDKTPSTALSNSDKTATFTGASGFSYVRSSTKRANGAAGKYYAEFVAHELTAGIRLGISNATADYPSANAFYVTEGGIVAVDGVSSAVNLGAAADGDIFGVAWDAGAERVWFRRNAGLWNNDAAADPATNTNGLDVSAHASVDHALWARLDLTSGVSTTLRTEAAEFTYTGPSGFTSWMGEALSSVTHYTLTADSGTFTLTGQAATLVKVTHYNLTADLGSLTLTGITAAMKYGRMLIAASGTFTLTGVAAATQYARKLIIASGSLALTGIDAALTATTAKKIIADVGAFTLTGIAAGTQYGHKLTAATNAFALTGFDATARYAHKLIATTGAFALTGVTAITQYAHKLIAVTGAVLLSGKDVTLRIAQVLSAQSQAFLATGIAALLVHRRVYAMAAATGAVTLTGFAAALSATSARVMLAAKGTLTLTGVDATLRAVRVYKLVAVTGTFTLTGIAAITQVARKLIAASGEFTLTGTAANLFGRLAYRLSAQANTLLLTGSAVDLIYNPAIHYTVEVSPGIFTLVEKNTMLLADRITPQPGRLRFGRPVPVTWRL